VRPPTRVPVLALVAAVAVPVAGIAPAPATAAATVATRYGFQTHAYGTVVTAGAAGLRSGKTAFSWVSCTKLAGKRATASLAAGATPTSNPAVRIGAVTSTSETYRVASTGEVGTRSVNTVGSVDLVGTALPGSTAVPRLKLQGLRTTARAWAVRGRLHATTDLGTVDVDVSGVDAPATGTPLDDLLHGATSGIDGVVSALRANGGAVTVPGLGVVSLGLTRRSEGTVNATATATALQVRLFGADLVSAADDSTVTIGRATARVTTSLPAGAMTGKGYGVGLGLLGGVLTTGELGVDVLPCQGTGGTVKTESLASVAPPAGGLVQLGAVGGRVYGIQAKDRSARAWTEGRVASFAVGGGASRLEISGIVGRAVVSRTRTGHFATSTRGTTVGSVTIGGRPVSIPADRTLTVPGVADVLFGVQSRGRRSVSVTAVRVTLLATPGLGRVDLGNARVAINP
jgi:hypothetical protein